MSSFAEVLKEAGEFGLFQKCLLLTLCVPSFVASGIIISQVFTDLNFPHHCNTDWILERGPNLTKERQRNLTLPLNENGQYESCRMFTPVDWDLETIEAYGINSTTECINGWDYDVPRGASSTVKEFDLVCNNIFLIAVSQSIMMTGFLVGELVYGAISDRFGRRFTILLMLIVLIFGGVGAALSPNIYVHVFFRFFYGGSGVISDSVCVLAVEWTSPAKYPLSATFLIMIGTMSLVVFPGIAYLLPNWRVAQLVFISPNILVVGLCYWFLPESARWLLIQGKKEAAQKELRRAARINGREIPETLLEQLEMVTPPKKENVLDLFKSPYFRKLVLLLAFTWFSINLVFFGLVLNVGGFGMDIYITQALFGICEIPAFLTSYMLTRRLGVRKSLLGFLGLGGLACLLILVIPAGLPVVTTVVAVFGKFFISASFSAAFIYSAQCFPTNLRQNGMGLTLVFARVGGIVAPLILLLDVFHTTIPMVIFGTFAIVAGGLCLLLPETKNMEVQDCIQSKKPEDGTKL